MKIIEFFGTPGSGKTTESFMLYNKLVDEGYDCLSFRKNEYSNVNVRKKNFGVLRIFLPTNLFFFIRLTLIYIKGRSKENYKKGNIFEKLIILLRQVMYMDTYRQYSKNKNLDFLISDQGLVQELSSLFLENNSSMEVKRLIDKYLRPIRGELLFIYIQIPADEAINRTIKRNRKSSSMDFYEHKVLKDFINEYSKDLKEWYIFLNDKYDIKVY